MKFLKIVILVFTLFFGIENNVNSYENKILIKINNHIITSLDIAEEINYLSLINEEYEKLDRSKAIKIAKNSLIREKIKEIELLNFFKEIKIEEEFLNQFTLNYFARFGIKNITDFNNFFLNENINPELVKKKISIEVLWNQIIYKKFNKNIKIDEESIKKKLIKNSKQKEFLLSEILFNLEENEKLNDKLNLIKKNIYEKSFSEAALIYSVSNSSSDGGKLKWIKESILSDKIKNELNIINVGDMTKPIVIPGGFLILKIENIREIEINYNINDEIKSIIKQKRNEQLNQLSNIYFSKIKKNIKIDEL